MKLDKEDGDEDDLEDRRVVASLLEGVWRLQTVVRDQWGGFRKALLAVDQRKINIKIEEGPKLASVGDYWDKHTMSEAVASIPPQDWDQKMDSENWL